MKYDDLMNEIREIVSNTISDSEIEMSTIEWGYLEKVIASEVCTLIMRNFKDLEF